MNLGGNSALGRPHPDSQRAAESSRPRQPYCDFLCALCEEDIWDIGGITAFFALSNRMAHLIAMRPNDEFYLLGRVPPAKK